MFEFKKYPLPRDLIDEGQVLDVCICDYCPPDLFAVNPDSLLMKVVLDFEDRNIKVVDRKLIQRDKHPVLEPLRMHNLPQFFKLEVRVEFLQKLVSILLTCPEVEVANVSCQ